MLGKLIKTDLKSTARIFVPICAGLMILAIAMILCMVTLSKNESDNGNMANITSGVAYMLYSLTLFVFTSLAFFIPLQRFHRCVLKNDAYLMLSIPVHPWMHVVSKLVCSLVWYAAAQICRWIITSIMFMQTSDVMTAGDVLRGIQGSDIGNDVLLYTVLSFLTSLLMIIFAQLFLYMMFVIGSLFNKNRGIATVLLSIGGVTVLSWVYGVVVFTAMRSQMFKSNYGSVLSFLTYGFQFASCIYFAVFSVVFYIVTTVILGKKYNLP